MYTIPFSGNLSQFASGILIPDLSSHGGVAQWLGCVLFPGWGGVAQWLEQRAHNLLVAGSNPATPTRNKHTTSSRNELSGMAHV